MFRKRRVAGMKQKKYIDIERLKFSDKDMVTNTDGFQPGDLIQITEKWDGSNASIRYDAESGKLVAFSRKKELKGGADGLRGFWEYVQSLNADDYKDNPDYVIFGEWGVRHSVKYNPEAYGKWYVYDIFDVNTEMYLPQAKVKQFVEEHNLTYIHVLYEGEFISWEHCKSFCNSPAYGEVQEGIVVKNQTRLNNPFSNLPFYLKIVNDAFSEVMVKNRKTKIVDPEKEKAMEQANQIVDTIVTKRRIEKQLLKMRDEGIVPEVLELAHIPIIAKTLPKRVYDDCVKEEREMVEAAGEYFGKMCNGKVMKFVQIYISQGGNKQ